MTRKQVLSVFVLLGMAFALGCSQSGDSIENPVAGVSVAGSTSSNPTGSETGQIGTAGAKSLICHNDVDDDHLYDSISIWVADSSVGSHFTNHGDCYTADPVGTENCSCL
jgi:hypothetical protein